ncbi:MAG: penicillin-binding protein 1C, partial [Gammaproteobacteria bacterium]|nr:penicillin-binding protein 1C [Gammaproteobacteria bacterium]
MRPHRIRFVKRFAQLTALVVLINIIFPPPVETVGLFASVVVDRHGVPLRAFADKQGIWRYPVKPHEISPNYLEALINYEDRYFWLHPGVNPIALLRAFKQNISHGRIISGGSTITMQVARLIDPHSRNLGGKLKQVFRAIQLELMYSKTEILTLYLNRAPFGGPIEGVQAAAFTYLGKSAQNLSDAEAALLAVLPQAPSFNRPDRYPQRAQKVRDKLIERMQISGVWTSQRAQEAKLENVWAEFNPQPMNAPLLSRYVISQNPGQGIYHSTIDFGLQQGLASFVRDQALMLPAATSIAVLVADNRSLAVRAYVGSGAFNDDSRFGHVDMVQATRSPGSTLKPFLYGMAMDQGLIHSESLLSDAPSNFGDYSPENFGSGFEGPIGVTQALQKSLNVPAVQVLDALGSNVFLLSLKNAGMKLSLPMGAKANLAITLGGVGTSLFDLVGAYTAFANNGLAGKLRVVEEMPVNRRYILS